MRLLDALRYSSEILHESGIDDPLADAEILVFDSVGTERLKAYMDNPEISSTLFLKIKKLTARRAGGEPVQYITGHVDFCGLKIEIGRGVLIPRPETELLVEEAVKTLKRESLNVKPNSNEQNPITIIDLCTGSGCIALALASEFPGAQIFGTDISLKALSYAKKNAAANNIENVTFKKGSLFGPIKPGAMFDLIVSNPPYIIAGEIPELQREVRDWEPLTALDGGADGLDFYRRIISEAEKYLKPEGALIMELGYGQAAAVTELARHNGFLKIEVINDFAGIGRIMKAERRLAQSYSQ
jgi:release factor glutamine methyltransferase